MKNYWLDNKNKYRNFQNKTFIDAIRQYQEDSNWYETPICYCVEALIDYVVEGIGLKSVSQTEMYAIRHCCFFMAMKYDLEHKKMPKYRTNDAAASWTDKVVGKDATGDFAKFILSQLYRLRFENEGQ